MALVKEYSKAFSCQAEIDQFSSTCTLRPQVANCFSWRYLSLWYWSRNFTYLSRWVREAHSLCVKDFEKNFAQVEKEALALIFGLSKFHQYLYGRTFILQTDHKSLTTIFGPTQGIPSLAATRLQR